MTIEYHTLPGGCYVNEIKPDVSNSGQHGVFIESELLEQFGFSPQQPLTVFFTQGRIIIVTDPAQLSLLQAIQELQIRQDEMGADFAPAITQMLKLF